jgi:hypothetical protein
MTNGVVGLSRRASLVPMGLSADGRAFYAAIYSARFSGVVKVDARTSRYTRVRRFPDARNDQAVGTFGGRWLVWEELHSLSDPGDFTVWAWDARTGRARQIGAAERGPSGEFWESPFRDPDVRGGYATWAQGSGPEGVTDVHVYDLLRDRDRVVRHGHAQGSFFVGGGRIVWPESPRPGAATRMFVADVSTGASLPVPPSLNPLRGVSGLATDGTSIAFPNGDYTALSWSPSLTTAPRRVFSTGNPGDHIDNSVQIAGRFAAFGVPLHSFLADVRARRYVQIGAGGFGRLSTGGLVFLRPSKRKKSHAITDVVVLRRGSFPSIPRCSRP